MIAAARALDRTIHRRRSQWWRRLLWWVWPWPRALLPDYWRTDELQREAEHDRALARWRANPDGRPAPTSLPSCGIPRLG